MSKDDPELDFGSNIDDDQDLFAAVDKVEAEVKKAPKKKAAAKPKPKVHTPNTTRIQLEENDDIPPTGLYVGHNGRGYLIRVGEPVDVPLSILEILDHSVISTPTVDPQTRQVTGYRDRMKYPYRLVRA